MLAAPSESLLAARVCTCTPISSRMAITTYLYPHDWQYDLSRPQTTPISSTRPCRSHLTHSTFTGLAYSELATSCQVYRVVTIKNQHIITVHYHYTNAGDKQIKGHGVGSSAYRPSSDSRSKIKT